MLRIACLSAVAVMTVGLLALASAAGCGDGVIVAEAAGTTTGGEGGKVEDAGTDAGGAGGSRTCPDDTPPPSPTPPTEPGCYANDGSGWIEVPCSCELWIANPDPTEASVAITLTTAPGAAEPSLNAPPDAEIAFDDPDASWFTAWTTQPGSGDTFAVTREAGTTKVRMGASNVTLAPVALTACRRRDAEVQVGGVPATTIEARAELRAGSGHTLKTFKTTCAPIPPVTGAPP